VNKTVVAVVSLCVVFLLIQAVNRHPRLTLIARPNRGDLGIGIQLRGTFHRVDSNGDPLKARVEVKKPSGEVVYEITDDLSKFSFG
jgi:hypothetical protein